MEARGREFESRLPDSTYRFSVLAGPVADADRRMAPAGAGTVLLLLPTALASLAQLAERQPLKLTVLGSTPRRRTHSNPPVRYGLVEEPGRPRSPVKAKTTGSNPGEAASRGCRFRQRWRGVWALPAGSAARERALRVVRPQR